MTKLLSSNTLQQRYRLLDALRQKPMTTNEIRVELDIFHPGQRVLELRSEGHEIFTFRTVVNTDKGRHRQVARYVLLSANQAPGIKKPAESANKPQA